MFLILMDILAGIILIGFGWLAIVFLGAGLGALIGNTIVGIRDVFRKLRGMNGSGPSSG